jgi:hypothetical protein
MHLRSNAAIKLNFKRTVDYLEPVPKPELLEGLYFDNPKIPDLFTFLQHLCSFE